MNAVKYKSKAFAIRIIKLYQILFNDRKEQVLSKQLLRSGTSIGANVTEALCAFSKKDFLAKMYISFKEAAETQYWLELLYETQYVSKNEFDSISGDCEELRKMLSSITKTCAESIKQSKTRK